MQPRFLRFGFFRLGNDGRENLGEFVLAACSDSCLQTVICGRRCK